MNTHAAPPSIPHNWTLPPGIMRRLGAKAGRQRAMEADGHLLIILHAPPGEDHDVREPKLFWRDTDGKWRSNDGAGGVSAIGRLLDEYQGLLAEMEEEDDEAGDAEHYFSLLERLAPVVRAARHLHSALQEARQLAGDDRDVISARDRAYEIDRAAELQYGETKNNQELYVSRQAERQAAAAQEMAAASHRLNLLAAFFLPLATLSGVLGVNLEHGLETSSPPLPFLLHVLVGLGAGVLLSVAVVGAARPGRGKSR